MTGKEKEEKVREALGVEKKFEVSVNIPITTYMCYDTIIVKAINEDAAEKRAIEWIKEGTSTDDAGVDITVDFDNEQTAQPTESNSSKWTIDVGDYVE